MVIVFCLIRTRPGDERPSQHQRSEESGSASAWRPRTRVAGEQREEGREDSGRNTSGTTENTNWRTRERTRLDR